MKKPMSNKPNYAAQRRHGHKRYSELKAAGLCVSCGKTPAREGKTRCAQCQEKAYIGYLAFLARRVEARLCQRCGHPLRSTEAFKSCFACRQKAAEQTMERKIRERSRF